MTTSESGIKQKRLPPIRNYLILMNLTLLLLFASISLIFWQQIGEFRERKQQQDIQAMHAAMQASSASLMRSMVLSVNQAVTGYDFSFLNALIRQVVEGDDEILSCQIVSDVGMVIAHNDPSEVGKIRQSDLDRQALALMKSDFQAIGLNAPPIKFLRSASGASNFDDLLVAVSPVHNGRKLWGILRCSFSTERLHRHIQTREQEWALQLRQAKAFYLTVVGLFVLLGFSVALVFTRRLLKVISELTAGVRQVSEGELSLQLDIKDLVCAEFASLAHSFDRMTLNLESSRKQLDEYNFSLEQKVAERTTELERSNKELEAFNYSVSHDLRAPLRSIDGFSQALAEDYHSQLDETGQDYLRRVRAAANRMGLLIDDMLRLSRLGRQEMTVGEVNLTELAESVVNKLRETDTDRSVAFKIEPGLKARGDAHLLGIALDNLIGNAWKYSARREHAEIEVGQTLSGGKRAYYVHDNGAGFDMKYADKLFGAFQRLHKSTEFEGTGVGLATVARIVHRHGGSIWAEAEVDKGATFYFNLPE
jgi:signal transduction histidine kinase